MAIKSSSIKSQAQGTLITNLDTTSRVAGVGRVHVTTPLDIPDCALWYEGDSNITGAVVDTAAEPYVYTSIPNLGSLGGTLASAGAVRPAVGWLECGGVARRVPAYDGTSMYEDSSLAAASWNHHHDGTGCTILAVCRSTGVGNQTVFDTLQSGTGRVGLSLRLELGANVRFYCGNGVGVAYTFDAVSTVDFGDGSSHIVVLRHASIPLGGHSEYEVRVDGADVTSGSYGAAASASNAFRTLRLGAQVNSLANYLEGQLPLIVSYSRYLTDNEVVALEVFASKYTNNSERVKASPTLWISPNIETTAAITVVDDKFSRIEDCAGNARTAIQATALDRPAKVISTEFGDTIAMEGDGTNTNMEIVGTAFGADTSHSVIIINDITDYSRYLFDSQTGRLVLASFGWYDGTWRNWLDSVRMGLNYLEFSLDAAATEGRIYENGCLVFISVYNPVALGGAIRLLSSFGGGSSNFFGDVAGLFLKSSTDVMTDTEPETLWKVRQEMGLEKGFDWTPLWHPGHVSYLNPSEYRDVWIEGALFKHPMAFEEWGNASLTATDNTTDLSDPNGMYHASKLVESVGGTGHHVYDIPFDCVDAFGWVEVDAHVGLGGSQRGVTLTSNNVESWARFDIVAGTVLATFGSCMGINNATITSLNNGWYRLRARILPRVASKFVHIRLNDGASESYSGDGVSAVYLHEAWYEQSAAHLPNPFDFNDVSWTKINVTLTAAQSDSDGGTNAFLLTDSNDGAPATHRIEDTPLGNESTAPSAFKVRLKAGTLNWAALHGAASSSVAFINLTTGTIGTTSGASFVSVDSVDLGNGWWEVTLWSTISNVCRVYLATADNTSAYQGDGTGTIYIYAPEVEQRRVLIEVDQSRKLAGLGDDMKCDDVGVASWNVGNTATLTKEVASPLEGTRNLRVSKVAAYGYASQNSLAGGTRYRNCGWYRTDGTATVRVATGNVMTDLPAVTSWSPIRAVKTATSAFNGYYKLSGTGVWAEFDDLSCVPSNDTYQSTAANQPIYWPATVTEPAHLQFDGVDDFEDLSTIAAVVTGTNPSWSVCMWVRATSLAADQIIWGAASSTSGTPFVAARILTTGAIDMNGRSDVGLAKNPASAAGKITADIWHHIAFTSLAGVVNAWVDGVQVITAGDFALGATTVDVGTIGAFQTFSFGVLAHMTADRGQFDPYDRAITEAEVLDHYANERAEYGV